MRFGIHLCCAITTGIHFWVDATGPSARGQRQRLTTFELRRDAPVADTVIVEVVFLDPGSDCPSG